MSYSLEYQSDRTYSLVTYRDADERECIGFRDESNDAIAKFGVTGESVVLDRWAMFARGSWGSLYWTERTDADYPGTTLTRRALSADGTVEEAASADVDWQTAEEVAPTDRTAQAQALAAMRRREAEANERTATLRHEIERLTAQLTNERQSHRDQLQAWWTALEEEAEERSWCHEFEQFVEANGGEEFVSTTQPYTVTMTVEIPKSSVRSGYGVDSSTIADRISDLDSYDIRELITEYSEA